MDALTDLLFGGGRERRAVAARQRREALSAIQEESIGEMVARLTALTRRRDETEGRADQLSRLAAIAARRGDAVRGKRALRGAGELRREVVALERNCDALRSHITAWQHRAHMSDLVAITEETHRAARALGLPLAVDGDRMDAVMDRERAIDADVRAATDAFDDMAAARRTEDELRGEGAPAVDSEWAALVAAQADAEADEVAARLDGVQPTALPSYSDALTQANGARNEEDALFDSLYAQYTAPPASGGGGGAAEQRPRARPSRALLYGT